MTPELNVDAVLTSIIAPHVALVTINRESARNAVNADVALGLERAARAVDADTEIRVAVLTGAGARAFCSGADLQEVSAGRIDALFTQEGGFAGLTRIRREKPWIAAVNGYAFAGGFEIALACDLMVASETASFGLPEVKVGLVAGGGGALRLPQRLPLAIAVELILTGETLSAERALALGLVNQLAPADSLIDAAIALATVIASRSPSSVRESLRIIRSQVYGSEDHHWAASDAALEAVAQNSDAVEGPAAFIEKRDPVWRDQQRSAPD